MPDRIRKLLVALLLQVPTVLTLALLGGVAWWGYRSDWKVPSLPVLLGRAQPPEEGGAKEEGKSEAGEGETPELVKIESEGAAETAGIKVGPVRERILGEFVKANGEVAFDQNRYAHLSTRAAGTAWRVEKNAGDQVEERDVLALVASPEVARLKFDLQQTLLLVDTRQRLAHRLKATGLATAGKEIESAEANLREARIRLFGDEQSLKNLGLTVRAEELTKLSDAEVADRLRTVGIPDSLLQKLDPTKLTSNLLPMYAPFRGVVVQRDIVVGEMVTPSNPQFILADLSKLWILLHVRQEDGRKLARGQEVAFHLDGPNEDAPPAHIVWISPEVDEKTHTIVARAEVSNDAGRLRPRTFGTARIEVDRRRRVTVPNGALQFDGKSHLVFVQGDSATEFRAVRVRLGERHEDFTEIEPEDPAVIAASTVGLLGSSLGQGSFLAACGLAPGRGEPGVKDGQMIAVEGSHVLLSEMLKGRIGGED